MKKAYLLLVHENPIQINILINQLLKDIDAYIYIHVNKLFETIKNELLIDKRVFILDNNINVYWGNESINEAIILLFKTAINSNIDYSYFSLRTGQDLQIKSGIDDFLKENNDKIFINPVHIKRTHIYYGHFSVNWPERTRFLYEKRWNRYRILRKLLLILNYFKNNLFNTKSYLPDNMELYWGRFWGFYPKDVVQYIINYYDSNKLVVNLFNKALVPEEMFLHTIIMNSYLKSRVAYNDLCMLSGHKNNHPTVILFSDIMNLDQSNYYFARKFDINVDEDVIEYYSNKILNSN